MMILGPDLWGLIAVYFLIGAALVIYALSEQRADNATRRKILHVAIGNFVLIWWLFQSAWVMLLSFVLPFLVILFLCHPCCGREPFRRTMIGEASREGHSSGLLFYVVSVGVMVLLSGDHIMAASMGILALAYGDGFGSLIGRKLGSRPLRGGKTVEGSLAVFAATAISGALMLLFYGFLMDSGHYVGTAVGMPLLLIAPLVAGIVASLAELLSPGEYDNLSIPLTVALTMMLLGL